ncbi:MAG TPA: hypothetical protein VMV78_01295 [Thiobacillus sp.]|nr:hypothetical protein [Thiobacillus sp.]
MSTEKALNEIVTGRNHGLLDHASRLRPADKESARSPKDPIAVIAAAITAARMLILFDIDTISFKA